MALWASYRLGEYRDVCEIARALSFLGFDVVTGGGPALMQAATEGHKSAQSGAHSIGLNIKLPHEQEANRFLDVKKDFDRFSSRLDTFVSVSDAIVVAPGGVGTLLELFYSWQLVQVGHLCETPIVLFGEMWRPLLRWLRDEVLSRGYIREGDVAGIFHATTAPPVVGLIRRVHDVRSRMEHVCVNYEHYRASLEELEAT